MFSEHMTKSVAYMTTSMKSNVECVKLRLARWNVDGASESLAFTITMHAQLPTCQWRS